MDTCDMTSHSGQSALPFYASWGRSCRDRPSPPPLTPRQGAGRPLNSSNSLRRGILPYGPRAVAATNVGANEPIPCLGPSTGIGSPLQLGSAASRCGYSPSRIVLAPAKNPRRSPASTTRNLAGPSRFSWASAAGLSLFPSFAVPLQRCEGVRVGGSIPAARAA
jgi:hypothetical protein